MVIWGLSTRTGNEYDDNHIVWHIGNDKYDSEDDDAELQPETLDVTIWALRIPLNSKLKIRTSNRGECNFIIRNQGRMNSSKNELK